MENKIDAKIDQKFDASWDRFSEGFWWIWGGKMEPSWHQKRSKIDANCEKRFFEKPCSRCSGGSIFEILGVEVGSKNRFNIDLKMKSTWEGILALIFHRFWWILGGKLGGQIEPRSRKNRSKKASKNYEKKSASWRVLGGARTRHGRAAPDPP